MGLVHQGPIYCYSKILGEALVLDVLVIERYLQFIFGESVSMVEGCADCLVGIKLESPVVEVLLHSLKILTKGVL